jgi:protein-S-isoprenylcysteine O-methyltransferase Ste14
MKESFMKYIPILELPILVIMVLVRAIMLRKHGVKVIVFGETNQSDFIIIPIVLCFLYSMYASVFDLPFPIILKKTFFEYNILYLCAIVLCTVSLIWFFITLKTFGKSFRVGIDENTDDKLIINGIFGISRNPIYVAFIGFFVGIFVAYSNIIIIVFLIILIITIHRQILREEIFLKKHYGKEYDEYCNHVRRYI